MFPYQLEKGSRKFACPRCGRKTFVRVIETAGGKHLPDHVGRCDRESNCGYQFTWKRHFEDDSVMRPAVGIRTSQYALHAVPKSEDLEQICSTDRSEAILRTRPPDYLEAAHLLQTLSNYGQNMFVQFLLRLFPNDPQDVQDVISEYLIGTKDGYTVFPTISETGKVCKAKLIKFDPETGKRVRDQYAISSLQARLKRAGELEEEFETDKEVFFGEHLLQKHPKRPVAIVEAEKTAVVASICKGVFPDFVWLATGSKQWLKTGRIKKLGRGRRIVLFPDADGFKSWLEVASKAASHGFRVKISHLIENLATDAEKSDQVDLADYLVALQSGINKANNKIAAIKGDQNLLQAVDTICEERKAIMLFDGGVTEDDAEAYLSSPRFIMETVSVV